VKLPRLTVSPREEQILQMLATGATYREIAARGGATPGAVRMTVSRMMLRAACRTRVELVARWVGENL
jgi:DNA-binding CsgD family transcriptional regulator